MKYFLLLLFTFSLSAIENLEIPIIPNMVPVVTCADCADFMRPGSYRETLELIENVTLWKEQEGRYYPQRIPMEQKQNYYMSDGTNFFESHESYMKFLSKKCFELSQDIGSIRSEGQWERKLPRGYSDFFTPTREINYSYSIEKNEPIKISYSLIYDIEGSLLHSNEIEQHSLFLENCFDSIEDQFLQYGVELNINRRIKNSDDYYVGRNPTPDQKLLYRINYCGGLRENTLHLGEGCIFRGGRERPIEDPANMRCNRLKWMVGIHLGLRDDPITTDNVNNIMTLRGRRVESGEFRFEPHHFKQILKPICPDIVSVTHP